MHSLQPDDITDLLVAYALDALEPEEMAKVSRLIEEQPELRHVVANLRATASDLPYAIPVALPPPDLRQRTLDYAVGRAPRRQGGLASAAPAPGRRGRGWLATLSGLAALATLLLLFTFGQLSAVRGQLDQAERALATAETSSRQVAEVLAQPVRLAELSGSGGRATVLQSADGAVLLAARLPPLAADKVYQLWVIAGESTPVSAGVFSVDSAGSGLLTLSPGQTIEGATLAVTSEPGPRGSPGPTGNPVIAGQAAS